MTPDQDSHGIDATTCMSALLSQTRPRLRERAKRIVAQGGV